MKRLASVLLIFALLSTPAVGAPPQNNDDNGAPGRPETVEDREKVIRQIKKIGVGERISVILWDGQEYYGTIIQIGTDHLQLNEVDLKRAVDVEYNLIKKVRKGYGGVNSITGKRVDLKRSRIILFAFVGALLGITILAASQTR